jgi:hypothetical protein
MAIKNTYYTATSFAIQIGGAFAGWAKKCDLSKVSIQEMTAATGAYHEVRKSGGNLEFGDFKFTYNISESGILLDWIQGVLRRDVIENDGSIIVADVNGVGRRAMDFIGGHIVDLKFSDLDAKEAKAPFAVDVTCKPRNIVYRAESNKIAAPQAGTGRQILTSNFRFQGLGDEIDKHVSKVTWPTMKNKIAAVHYGEKLLPDYSYSGFELGPLTIEVTASAYPAIEKLMKKQLFDRDVNDSSYIPLAVEMLSTNLTKTLLTVEMAGCHLQEVDQGSLEAGDKMSTIKLKFSTEEIKLALSL